MRRKITTIEQFLGSLSSDQMQFFRGREAEMESKLQSALRELGRGISSLSTVNGDLLMTRLSTVDSMGLA